YTMAPGESVITPSQVVITPGYFEAMSVRLVRGRFFTDADRTDGQKVIVIDEKLANKFWPGQDPVGRRMYQPNNAQEVLKITEKPVFMTVVGVVHDVTLHNLTEGQTAVGAIFRPVAQDVGRNIVFAVQTAGNPVALGGPMRGVLTGLDRELPVSLTSMDDR